MFLQTERKFPEINFYYTHYKNHGGNNVIMKKAFFFYMIVVHDCTLFILHETTSCALLFYTMFLVAKDLTFI